ncbi:hypothetical protein GCM10009847_01670 [Leucobacter tardus]|uniref:DUF6752 domain-containing protein n=1 Tax=Leucobacter tardus TaxID=501483 RepID=A0A939QNQ8_9MICO|nr:DUF6752 domain-containing protein [Leucobacter tardus]MBO2991074.1 hypothetical protein [Leucobacter tardus]
MKQRIKRVLRERLPLASAGALREVNARVEALERELDEYRRDSLRVAELIDLVETKLTPGVTASHDSSDQKGK